MQQTGRRSTAITDILSAVLLWLSAVLAMVKLKRAAPDHDQPEFGAAEFERFLAQLVPLPTVTDATRGGRAVRNVERVREAILSAYRQTPDLANVTGTRWGALQAVTAYVDHVQPTRATAGRSHQEARFERATEPAALKDRALVLLTEGDLS